MRTSSERLSQARHWLPLGMMLTLVVAFLAVAGAWVLGAADDGPASGRSGSPAPSATAARRLPDLGGLAAHLTRLHPGRKVSTRVRPVLQRALIRTLGSQTAAGVVVDVADGRLLAAAGAGGRSPWRSRVAPGASIDPVLAAGALDGGVVTRTTRLKGGGSLAAALESGSATAFQDVQVRLDGWTVDELLRRVGFDAPVRAGDLAGFAAASRGPALTPVGVHGVGNAANFIGPDGRFRDAGTLARATTLQLAQVALALASAGQRTDVGVTKDGPAPASELWSPATGRQLRALLPRSGSVVTVTGSTKSGASVLAFAPAAHPTVALALTSADPDQTILRTRAVHLLTTADR